MCGIAGIINRDAERPVAPAVLDAMTDTLRHRGPDGRGTRIWRNVGFGHRRLAIIDRETGAQPMGRDGFWITYNGELYNYKELRRELPGVFQGDSDTEVLLALYARHGVGMLERMNGMFAFALYDRYQRRILLARDRFGEKPLYVYHGPDTVLFASEIKALLVHPAVRVEIDADGLSQYRVFQHTLGERTLFRGITKLEPASYMELSDTGEVLARGAYWSLPTEHEPVRESDHEELAALVEDAVRLRLRSDVPVGAYLSGGLDSSVVATFAGDVPLFSGAFAEGGQYSELPYAAAVAARTGAEHHVVCPTADDFARQLESVIWHLDEPVAGPGAFAQYNVAQLAAEHVTVVLGGQGGDEVFGGYARHSIIGGGSVPDGYEELEWKAYCAMISRDGSAMPMPRAYLEGGPTPLARATSWDARTQLGALLHVEDRMSMAHSLESRLPLLDHRIAELVFARPDSFRHAGGRPKGALIQVGRSRVPDVVLDRTDKRGFPVPFVEWAKGPLRDYVGDLLGESVSADRSPHDRELWGRLCLAVWRQTFVPNAAMVMVA